MGRTIKNLYDGEKLNFFSTNQLDPTKASYISNTTSDILQIKSAGSYMSMLSDVSAPNLTLTNSLKMANSQWITFRNAANTNDDGVINYDSSDNLILNYGGNIYFKHGGTTNLSIVNGQLNSAITTGNAPFVVSSTTLVSNLNADLWQGWSRSSYLDQAVKTNSSVQFYSMTDGYTTFSLAQINRTGGNIELQFPNTGNVRMFGNGSVPIVFADGTITFNEHTISREDSSRLKFNHGLYLLGSLEVTDYLYSRNDIKILNKAANGWLTFASRNTSGSEAVYDLQNVGSVNIMGHTISKFDSNYLQSSAGFYTQGYHRVGEDLLLNKNIQIMNKAQNGWVGFAVRNTTGSEAVYDLSNIGTITVGEHIISRLDSNNLHLNHGFYADGDMFTGGHARFYNNIYFVNKASNAWLTFASRNTSGSEAVYDLSNVGSIKTKGSSAEFWLGSTNGGYDFRLYNTSNIFKIYHPYTNADIFTVDLYGNQTLSGNLTAGGASGGAYVQVNGSYNANFILNPSGTGAKTWYLSATGAGASQGAGKFIINNSSADVLSINGSDTTLSGNITVNGSGTNSFTGAISSGSNIFTSSDIGVYNGGWKGRIDGNGNVIAIEGHFRNFIYTNRVDGTQDNILFFDTDSIGHEWWLGSPSWANTNFGLFNHSQSDWIWLTAKNSKDITFTGNLTVNGSGENVFANGATFNNNIKLANSIGIVNAQDNKIFETSWTATFGDYTAINSGLIWDEAVEPVSVVASRLLGTVFYKATSAGTPFGFQLGRIDLNGNATFAGTVTSNGTGNNYFAGNVGILTNSPSYPLTVKADSSGNAIRVHNTNWLLNTSGSSLDFYFGSATGDTYAGLQARDVGGQINASLILQQYGDFVGIGVVPSVLLTLKYNQFIGWTYNGSDNGVYTRIGTSTNVLQFKQSWTGTPTNKMYSFYGTPNSVETELVGIFNSGNIVFSGDLYSTNFNGVDPYLGYYIGKNGSVFSKITANELHVKAFIADLEMALAGSQIISKSVAKIYSDFTVGGYLVVEDIPGYIGRVFANGDYIRLRTLSRTDTNSDGNSKLDVTDIWGTVTYVSRNDTTKTQTYSFAKLAGDGTTAKAGTLALDYGQSGNGIYETVAVGPLGKTPYSQIATWTTAPYTDLKPITRIGDFSGVTDAVLGSLTGFGVYTQRLYLSSMGGSNNAIAMIADNNTARLRLIAGGNTIFDFDTASSTALISDWTINKKGMYKTVGTSMIYFCSDATLFSADHASRPAIDIYESSKEILVSIGNIYKNSGNTGIALFTSTGSNTKIFEFSDGSAGRIAQIASFLFDYEKFTNTGNTFVLSNASTGKFTLGASASSINATSTAGIYMDGGGAFNFATDANNYIRKNGSNLAIKSSDFTLQGSTTLYIDTTKIALGASASSQVTSDTLAGFAVDTNGYLKSYINSTNYIRANASGVDIKAGTFTLASSNVSIGQTSGWFGANNILSYTANEVKLAGWTLDPNSISKENNGGKSVALFQDSGHSTFTIVNGAWYASQNAARITMGDALNGWSWIGKFGIRATDASYNESFFLSADSNPSSIAGWFFDSEAIFTGTKVTAHDYASNNGDITISKTIGISAKNFYLDINGNAKFRGDISGASGTIGDVVLGATGITAVSGGYSLTSSGLVATKGTIANYWNIGSSSIWAGSQYFNTAGAGNIYIGTSGISLSNTFSVTSAGVLTATSGTIGGWNISSDLYRSDTGSAIHLDGPNRTIWVGDGSGNNFVKMNHNGSGDWGIKGNIGGVTYFQLGNVNKIASWKFDGNYFYTGASMSDDGIIMYGGSHPYILLTGNGTSEVKMYFNAENDYGLYGYVNDDYVFRLGSTAAGDTNQIAGWKFDTGKLYNTGIDIMGGSSPYIQVNSGTVKMYYNSASDYGINGPGFHLGYGTNYVAGWYFDTASFYKSDGSTMAGMTVSDTSATGIRFFAGATDSVGTGARFKVLSNGRITVIGKDANNNDVTLFDSSSKITDATNVGRQVGSSTAGVTTASTSAVQVMKIGFYVLPGETNLSIVFRGITSDIDTHGTLAGTLQKLSNTVRDTTSSTTWTPSYDGNGYNSGSAVFGYDTAPSYADCFNQDITMITMANGANKLLSEVNKGDYVLTYNLELNKYETGVVANTRVASSNEYYLLNNATQVTAEHPFYTKRGWIPVKELSTEDYIMENLIWKKINSIVLIKTPTPITVKTLTVDNSNHNFIANGYLVHNKGQLQNWPTAMVGVASMTIPGGEGIYELEVTTYRTAGTGYVFVRDVSVLTGRGLIKSVSSYTATS